MNFNVYRKMTDGYFRCLNSKTHEFTTYKQLQTKKDNNGRLIGNFFLFIKKEMDENGMRINLTETEADTLLSSYLDNFNIWCDELDKEIKMSMKYRMCLSHSVATELVFKFYTAKNKHLYENSERIDEIEYKWIERTYNGGLMFCDKQKEPIQTFSYDWNFFYARLLGTKGLYIPNNKGYETTLNELPDELQLGFYHVKITSTNPDSKKIFAFNLDENVYNYYDLLFVIQNQIEYDFKIELIQDGEPNAYLYDDYFETSELFQSWFNKLSYLKRNYPHNQLIKQLGSSLWGVLSQHNSIDVEYNEYKQNKDKYKNYDIYDIKEFGEPFTENWKKYYVLIDSSDPYKYNIRLKSWLNSYARINTAKIAMTDIKNVIRIHTDSISFKTEHPELNNDLMKLENKSSGNILWNNVNNYFKVSS
jgi:hypothetical protein